MKRWAASASLRPPAPLRSCSSRVRPLREPSPGSGGIHNPDLAIGVVLEALLHRRDDIGDALVALAPGLQRRNLETVERRDRVREDAAAGHPDRVLHARDFAQGLADTVDHPVGARHGGALRQDHVGEEVALVLVRHEAGGTLHRHPHGHGSEEHADDGDEGDVAGQPDDRGHEAAARALQPGVEPAQGRPPAALVLGVRRAVLGSGLDQHQNAMTAARATAEA